MTNYEMKLKIIEIIVNMRDSELINTFYEIIVNCDLDYVQNLFDNDEFEDFIEKWTPNKCSEGEE